MLAEKESLVLLISLVYLRALVWALKLLINFNILRTIYQNVERKENVLAKQLLPPNLWRNLIRSHFFKTGKARWNKRFITVNLLVLTQGWSFSMKYLINSDIPRQLNIKTWKKKMDNMQKNLFYQRNLIKSNLINSWNSSRKEELSLCWPYSTNVELSDF